MAEKNIISKEDLASKLVQEIAKSGDVPEKYQLKDGSSEAIDDPILLRNSLLIDFSVLTSSTPTANPELEKLRTAMCEWGCFMVMNHGMENSFLDEMIEITREFFKLPLEEKHKCVATSDDLFQGYGNDRAYRDIPIAANWNDRLFLTLYPEEKRNLQFWPQKPEKIRIMLQDYSAEIRKITKDIYKAMARCLNLEDEKCFLNQQGNEEEVLGKLSIYPRCPTPEQVQGHLRHTDGTTMSTILVENEVDGLQILKDNLWYKVPVIPGALFINIGDYGEVMSNGVFKSVVHRVTANSLKDRVSVVAFCSPENLNEIGPINEFVRYSQPQKFRSFSVKEYRNNFFTNYIQGQSPLGHFKI